MMQKSEGDGTLILLLKSGKALMQHFLIILFYYLILMVQMLGGEDPVTTKKTQLEEVVITTKISKKQSAINLVKAFDPTLYINFKSGFSKEQFRAQLIERINNPYGMDQGHQTGKNGGTYFCWAAAASSLQFERNPRQMAELMMSLFQTGKANLGGLEIELSQTMIDAIGSSTFDNDGGLKNSLVDQMLFLAIGGSLKRYINVLNQVYQQGDEDALWASGTFGKFNELMKLYGNSIVTSQGSDLITPGITALQLLDAQKNGEKIFLFVYNDHFKNPKPPIKSDRGTFDPYYPTGPSGTHFVQIRNITINNGLINMEVWDYGCV